MTCDVATCPRLCEIDGCERPHKARGWCRNHYQMWQKHGDPLFVMDWTTTLETRFWAKVTKTETCWLWTGAHTTKGYGRIWTLGGRHAPAHHVAWELLHGPLPDGTLLDHACHVPACVNPDHLRIATVKQNGENLTGLRTNNTSGVRGVSWHKRTQKWRAAVKHNYKSIYVGVFDDIADAEAAVIKKRNELFTHNDADRAAS